MLICEEYTCRLVHFVAIQPFHLADSILMLIRSAFKEINALWDTIQVMYKMSIGA